MKTRMSSKALLSMTVWLLAFCGMRGAGQTAQPGNPPTGHLPSNHSAAGTVETPLATVPSPTLPSGWAVRQDDNGCQWAVPGGWYLVQHNVDALSYADGSGKALLHGAGFSGDWDKYKQRRKQQLHPTKILADSADRLWVQYSKGDGGLHYFVATVGTLFICSAHIDVQKQADLKDLMPVADQMAGSVRPSSP
jgi:hypothetical protein